MAGFFTTLFLKENIALIFAVVAFAISVYNLVLQWLRTRKNVDINVLNVFRVGDLSGTSDIVNMQIVNQSREAITVSQMVIECQDQVDQFGDYAKLLIDRDYKKGVVMVDNKKWFADKFPAKIEGLGFVSGLYISNGDKKILEPNKLCKIELITNKGKIYKLFRFMEFTGVELLSQCRPPN